MDVAREELKKMLPLFLLFSVMLFVICGLAGTFSWRLLLSTLYGAGCAVVLFLLLGLAVDRAVHMEPAAARKYMTAQYFVRYFITAGMLFLAIEMQMHLVAAIVPLFFPKIILILKSLRKKKGNREQ